MKHQEKSLKIGFFFSQNVENNKMQKETVVINLAPFLPPLAVLWRLFSALPWKPLTPFLQGDYTFSDFDNWKIQVTEIQTLSFPLPLPLMLLMQTGENRLCYVLFCILLTNTVRLWRACVRENWLPRRLGKHRIFLVLLYYFNYLLDRYSNHYRLEIAFVRQQFPEMGNLRSVHNVLSWHLAGRSRGKKKTLVKGKSLF